MIKIYSSVRDNARLLLWLGVSSLLFGVGAVPGLSQSIPVTTASGTARAALIAGRDLAENQHLDQARYYFTKALANDSSCAIAYLYLAQVSPQPSMAYVKNLKQAIAWQDKASAGERLLIQIEQARANGQPAQAVALLQKLVQKYPNDQRIYLAQAHFYLSQVDYTAAAEILKTGIKIAPDFPPFSLWLGQIAVNTGQFPVADEAIRKYQQLLPDEPQGYLAAGNLYLKKGLYPEATKSFAAALQRDPQFYPAYIGLSTVHVLQNKPAEAREYSEKLLALAPDENWHRQALFALSVIYIDEGKYDKALIEAKKSLDLARKSPDAWAQAAAHNHVGNIYLAQNNISLAWAQYEQAQKLAEQAAGFANWKNAARLSFLAREVEIALADKNATVARQKLTAYQKLAVAYEDVLAKQDAQRLRGLVAMQEKQYQTAILAFSKANPYDPRTWYLAGTAQLAQGDKAQARLHWATAAQFNQLQYEYLLIRRKVKI